MKRLWFPLLLILLIALTSLFISYNLMHMAEDISSLLLKAQSAAESGQTLEALHLTEQAEKEFLDYGTYLHSILNHQTIDSILSSFSEVLNRLRSGECDSAYATANSALLIQFQLLADSERLSLKNLL